MIQSIDELENISEIETPFFLYDTSLLHETLQCLKRSDETPFQSSLCTQSQQ